MRACAASMFSFHKRASLVASSFIASDSCFSRFAVSSAAVTLASNACSSRLRVSSASSAALVLASAKACSLSTSEFAVVNVRATRVLIMGAEACCRSLGAVVVAADAPVAGLLASDVGPPGAGACSGLDALRAVCCPDVAVVACCPPAEWAACSGPPG